MRGYGKTVVLVGERHVNSNLCDSSTSKKLEEPDESQWASIWRIWYQLASYAKDMGVDKMDVFVEHPFRHERKIRLEAAGPLEDIQYVFSSCYPDETKSRDWPQTPECAKLLHDARIHFVDLRGRSLVDMPRELPASFKEWFDPFVKIFNHMVSRFWIFREVTHKQTSTKSFHALPKHVRTTLLKLRQIQIQKFEKLLRQDRAAIDKMKLNHPMNWRDFYSAISMLHDLSEQEHEGVETYTILRIFKPYVKVALVVLGDWHIEQLVPILHDLRFKFLYEAPMATLPFRKLPPSKDACVLLPAKGFWSILK